MKLANFSLESPTQTITVIGLGMVTASRIRPKVASQDAGSTEAAGGSRLSSALSPALSRGSLQILTFLVTCVAFAAFFTLLIPDGQHTLDWFSVVAGLACLPVAAWCLSVRRACPLSVGILALLLLFGGVILLSSPRKVTLAFPPKVPEWWFTHK